MRSVRGFISLINFYALISKYSSLDPGCGVMAAEYEHFLHNTGSAFCL